MMRRIILFVFAALAMTLAAWGNDGVFYVNGNQLVPIQETDIALTKEVLTISLGDDGYAKVDVQFQPFLVVHARPVMAAQYRRLHTPRVEADQPGRVASGQAPLGFGLNTAWLRAKHRLASAS
jgi:hypothetical protein